MVHLADAVERLLDLRGLIETTYSSELRSEQLLDAVRIQPEPEAIASVLEFALGEHQKNQDRLARMQLEIDKQLQNLDQIAKTK